jgi:glycosyltransferase involved in cell wall biosynthesis
VKILIVSNLYPPHYLGGYELRCAQVAEALLRAGHEVQVITSEYRVAGEGDAAGRKRRGEVNGIVVHRCLREYIFPRRFHPRPWSYFQAGWELADARHFKRVVDAFGPDIVSWWSLYGLSKLLLPQPARWGIPDVYWVEQSWLIDQHGPGGAITTKFWLDFWEGKWGSARLRALTRAVGRRWETRAIRDGVETRNFSTPPRHVCFVSKYMSRRHYEAGMTLPSSEVIPGGVSVAEFLAPLHTSTDAEPLRLLYAGQLTPDRGLHTVVEAMGLLPPSVRGRVTLRIAGEGQPLYLERVRSTVQALGLAPFVSFVGRVPHDAMPALYRSHDVLVFPSERHEGLPLSIIEAMLSGCAVLTTQAGGAREIADGAKLPTFPPGSAGHLASLLWQMVTDRGEVARIAARGQEVAAREFSFDQMFTRFMTTLVEVANGGPR